MIYWQGKTAVVTGGSSGLGFHIASALVQAGAQVVLVARDETRLQAARSQFGQAADVFACDVTNPQHVDRLGTYLETATPKIDALFNCAGQSDRRAVQDTKPEDFQRLYELNFLGLVRCTRALLPALLDSRGHVVNIGSLASKSASRFIGAYPSSKFAVAAYSQQLRLELAPKGLHVLLVCPGPIAGSDAPRRFETADVPDSARQPGGGVRLRGIDPKRLSEKILAACQSRRLELVLPKKAKLLFALAQISPRLGDWVITKMTR